MMCQLKANFPRSQLNQRLNPLRSAPLWGQLVAMPSASRAMASRVAQPAAAPQGPLPLWLALQPYANARLSLFDVDRPESRSPVPIRRHVIDCFLEQQGSAAARLPLHNALPCRVATAGARVSSLHAAASRGGACRADQLRQLWQSGKGGGGEEPFHG
jgi:hypothetical protein